MSKSIQSIHNPSIKKILQLQSKSRLRRKEKLFVIEGIREIELAIKGGYALHEIYFCTELCSENTLKAFEKVTLTEVTLEVYQKMAYRGSTEGVIAVAHTKEHTLNALHFKHKKPLILVAEAPEKPGNIGALLRTADAANLDAVIIANPKTDMHNPNIVRSSVGGLFTNQIATGTSEEIIAFLKEKNTAIYTAILQTSRPYTEMDFTQSTAIVVGTEATGLSEIWRENATQNIHIPMQGQIDSMNVSVAAGILIFEAKRQRSS